MKKLIVPFLAAVVCLSLAACGGGSESGSKTSDSGASNSQSGSLESGNSEVSDVTGSTNDNTTNEDTEASYHIGDTVETDLYQIELKNAQLARNILVCKGENADKATFTVAEEFFTPSDTAFADEEGYVVEGIHGFSPSKSSGEIYLYYCLEFKYLGKEERTVVNYDFSPIVDYEDYTFDSDYFSFYRTKSASETSSWSNFDSDFDATSAVRALGLEIGYFDGKVKPLSDEVYEVRGVIPVPETIADDVNATLTLHLAGVDFVIN